MLFHLLNETKDTVACKQIFGAGRNEYRTCSVIRSEPPQSTRKFTYSHLAVSKVK